ncbi:MAG: hypothetical protein RID93_13815, partial [Sandaracinaceae bacterium]
MTKSVPVLSSRSEHADEAQLLGRTDRRGALRVRRDQAAAAGAAAEADSDADADSNAVADTDAVADSDAVA